MNFQRVHVVFQPCICCKIYLSSQIADSQKRGQEKIISLVEAVGGARYINLSGGRDLYDQAAFQNKDIELRFLTQWKGDFCSVLEHCHTKKSISKIRGEMVNQTQFE